MIRRAGLQHAAGTKAEISSSGSMVYLIGRMKRDNPAIAKALARGEFRSTREAAIAAGVLRDYKYE